MAINTIINSFNAGELSPHILGRTDLAKYFSGCRTMENFIALRYGGSMKRPGTYCVAEVKTSSKKVRLIGFQYSTVQAYILEFGDEYIRFYKDGGQIVYEELTLDAGPAPADFSAGATLTGATSGKTCIVVEKVSSVLYKIKHRTGDFTDGEVISDGTNSRDCGTGYPQVAASSTPCEITSPYLEADLFKLHYRQSADVMYITQIGHTYAVYKLCRLAHDDWTLTKVNFQYGPFLPENPKQETTYTSDVCSGGTATADSETTGGEATKAFDDNTVTFWETTTAFPHWLQYDFGAGVTKKITKYTLQACYAEPGRMVKDWTFLASNTGVFGGEEVTLDTQTNQTGWTASEKRSYTFANTTAYRYYRINITAGNHSILRLNEMEMMEHKTAAITITPSATTDYVTLTASEGIFTANHVGSIWQLIHNRASSLVEGDFTAGGQVSSTIAVSGKWQFTTHGTWTGTIQIQRSYDGGSTWQPYHSFKGVSNNYTSTGDETEEDVLYRLKMINYAAGPCSYCLSVDDNSVKGIVKVNSYVNPTVACGEVLSTLGNTTATARWSEGAWSDERGYAGTPTFYEGRLWFGGSAYQPQRIWGSKTGEYANFRKGMLAEHSVDHDVEADEVNAIKWLVSHEVMAIGTMGAEWKLGSPDPTNAITPDKPMYPRRQTAYGSSDVQSLLVANDVIFVQDDHRTVRAFRYVFEQGEAGGYRSEDITLYADHITESGIVWMAWQKKPEPVLWCGRADGQVIGLTFEPGQIIFGWHRHVTDGEVESGAVISGTSEDEVWISVKRGSKRFVEQFKPRNWGSDDTDCFFVDCGITFDGGDAYDITGATQAKPVVVTCTAHPFSNGEQVKIVDVVGMTELNDKVYTVANKGDNNFELKDADNEVEIDGTEFTAYTSGGTAQKVENTFTGLTYLEGKTVAILADGASHSQKVVSGGTITLDYFANKVHVGLPYTATLQPMPLEMATREGTAQGRKKRIHELVVRFYKTVGCKVGPDANTTHEIQFREPSDAMGAAIPLFSGPKKAEFPGDYDDEGNITIVQDEPLPCTVESIVSKWGLYG
ncbi:MAG: ubiquitin-activating E1 FCCH domain-containing protein [Planctomycetota bacterium]|jgi:hypothetical protein